jgi:methionine synthase II (cobalamin-independent)
LGLPLDGSPFFEPEPELNDNSATVELHGLPLGIGSMPHVEAASACRLILEEFPESPFWPELPKKSWRESMGLEQGRGLPGFVIDENEQRVYFDSDRDITGELGDFYEAYLAGRIDEFAISDDFVSAFRVLEQMIGERGYRPRVLKGQLTGPTTLGLVLKDRRGRPLLYNDQMMDVLVKATGMKAAWLAARMAALSDRPVIFFDEPMLQSVGSATVSIDRETCVKRLREIVAAAGCLSGGHCCGNTDWSIMIEAGLDVIAFDAWRYANTVALYPDELRSFIDRGGWLAWGIVPASREALEAGHGLLLDKLAAAVKHTALKCDMPADRLLARSLVTPSCGLGSLPVDQAEKIMAKTARLAGELPSLSVT